MASPTDLTLREYTLTLHRNYPPRTGPGTIGDGSLSVPNKGGILKHLGRIDPFLLTQVQGRPG